MKAVNRFKFKFAGFSLKNVINYYIIWSSYINYF